MTKFDEQVVCGQDYVALREIDRGDKIDVNGFVLTNTVMQNEKLGIYKVESIGPWASETTGVVPGDIVFADRLASFYHSSPVALMEIKNVIAKCSSARADDIIPLKGKFVVEADPIQQESVNGFYVTSSKPHTGIIVSIGEGVSDDWSFFNIGDRVMIPKGGAYVSIGNRNLFVFEPDKIICKIVEKK